MTELTAERARKLLAYNPETGVFKWRLAASRSVKPGSVAGTRTKSATHPYLQIAVDRKHYLAHRLAWLIVFGRWPEQFIDHINGDGLDNRLCNLREATPSQNMCNMKRPTDNTSGYKGVYPVKRPGWFAAQIKHNGKAKYLGQYDTPEAAHAAYCKAANELHGEFANDGTRAALNGEAGE